MRDLVEEAAGVGGGVGGANATTAAPTKIKAMVVNASCGDEAYLFTKRRLEVAAVPEVVQLIGEADDMANASWA